MENVPAPSPASRETANPEETFLFSVVTAAYNAAPWLGMMLGSLDGQTLGFDEHIQLIVVDDGSTDRTADMVREFVERHPDNAVLISQENAGPAAARNLGLTKATGEWVSFIDSDDFISPSYFETIRNFLENSGFTGNVAACNTLIFLETENMPADWHPLGYKFRETRIVDLLQEPDYIQLFANSCVIRRKILMDSGVRFDPRVKPSFEDAHFLNLALLKARDFHMAFIREAHYYYRKRGIGTGLVETGWRKPEKYRDQLLFGYLDLLRQYKRELGHPPDFVQNLVIYEFHWYLDRMSLEDLSGVLSEKDMDAFLDLTAAVFQLVDAKRIILSSLPTLDLRSRVIMLGVFKGLSFNDMPFMVADISPGDEEVRLVHYATSELPYALREGEREAEIPWGKRIVHIFGSRVLCHEFSAWAPLGDGASRVPVAGGRETGVLCRGNLLNNLDPAVLRQCFYAAPASLKDRQRACLAWQGAPEAAAFKDCWLLMDRVHKADDSAEHLCRWLLREHPELPVFFVLDRKSPDWNRLSKEGFPLLPHLGTKHLQAMANAAWVVSSHVDKPEIDPLRTREIFGMPSYKVAFLQHGIIKEDLSRWLNNISLDCVVTSAPGEFESLIGGRYKFTEREMVLTGLPRLDALLHKSRTMRRGKTILFCPTWRQHLRRTPAHEPGLPEREARLFSQSQFFEAWSGVTGSPVLAEIAREHGYKMLFLPHPEVVRFLPLFPRSEAFSYLDWASLKSFQDLLASCAMVVTDYSSLVFDAAYIGRPIAYYHFPETPDMYASNDRRPGYFDYERDGLGPVLRDQGALEAWIADMIARDCALQEPYESRANAFFPPRDGQNSRRVYEAIMARSKREGKTRISKG